MIRRRFTNFLASEDGWVSPFSLIMIISMLSVLGVATEYANIVRTKTQLQTASDSVALAAAQSMDNATVGRTYGMELAALYFGSADENVTLQSSDIEFGTWDTTNETFTASVVSVNAVQVTAEVSEARGNPLITAFSGLSGLGSTDITTESVVIASTTIPQTNVCESGGLFAGGWLTSGSNNTYEAGFCSYGFDGVDIGNSNIYDAENSIRGAFSATFNSGNSNTCEGGVCSMHHSDSVADDYALSLPNEVDGMITMLQAGITSSFVDGGLYTVTTVTSLPKRKDISSYTLYIVNGDAEFPSNGTYENIAVVATGEIKAGSNTSFDNVVFATQDRIRFGSNTTFGASDYCDDGRYHVYLFSGTNIEFGANNEFKGMQMAAKSDITFGSNVVSVGDVHGEAWGDIEYGTNVDMTNCATSLASDFDWDAEIMDDDDPILSYALVF